MATTRSKQSVAKPVEADQRVETPNITALVNAELDREYGWCNQNIPALLKAILREMVTARLTR